MSANDAFIRRDLKVLWHPCTQMKDHEQLPPVPIRRGQGVWLEDFEGRRYLDASELLVGEPLRPLPTRASTRPSPSNWKNWNT